MLGRRFRSVRVVVVVGALALVATAAALQPALAANPLIKNFSAVVTPTSVEAGSTYQYQLTISNQGPNPQTIGSANVTLPPGFRLRQGTAAGDPAAPTLNGPGSVLPTSNGDTVVRMRNMAVPTGSGITLTLTAEAPCVASPSGSPYAWGEQVKQSNDFSGPPGNDFTFIGAAATTAVTGACRLAYLTNSNTGLQVASAQVSSHITTDPYATAGIAVKVRVEAGAPQTSTVTFSTAAITLVAQAGGGGSVATGHDAASAGSDSPGVAGYTDSQFGIDTKGYGYTLRATTTEPGVEASTSTGPVSNEFNIDTSVAQCTSKPCHLNQTVNGGTGYELFADSDTGYLVASLTVQNFADAGNVCPNSSYVLPSESAAISWSLIGGTGAKQLLYTIESPLRSASKYQVCYARPQANGTFATQNGQAVLRGPTGAQYFVGLLLPCKSAPANTPCFQGYTVDKVTKAVTLITNAPPGDPWTH